MQKNTTALELGRCRYFRSVSVFGIFSVFFKVGIGIGILKYRDIGIGIGITDPGLNCIYRFVSIKEIESNIPLTLTASYRPFWREIFTVALKLGRLQVSWR